MTNSKQNEINEIRARIRGLKASMADMGYTMKQGVRDQIKLEEEKLAVLEIS